MQSHAADISDLEKGIEGKLALDGEVPVVSRRDLVDRILRLDELRRAAAADRSHRIIDPAVVDRDKTLERGIAAEESCVADGGLVLEAAEAGADDGLVVDLVSDADAWHNVVKSNGRVSIWQPVEQGVELRVAGGGETANGQSGETVARDHDTVINIPRTRDDAAGRRIDLHVLRWIVKTGIKDGVVAPQHVVRLHNPATAAR